VRILAATMTLATLVAAPIQFPRDHLGHSAGIEWWYFTGVVNGSDGHRYSIFFTIFKHLGFVVPVSQVVNLDNGRIVQHTERFAPGVVLPFTTRFGSLRYDPARNDWVAGAGMLRFTAHPLKPYVLHGGGSGVIRQGSSTSHYYSATRMTVHGSFGSVGFSGNAWFDHQWGDFQSTAGALHWDWFACRFGDDTELMLYRFRGGQENGTAVDRSGHGAAVGAFEAVPGTRVLDAEGRTWPLDWTLRVPGRHLIEHLKAIVPNQLFRALIVPTFWEGVATATGTKNGSCFVEETS
jgi:predicted secreted hydrolase